MSDQTKKTCRYFPSDECDGKSREICDAIGCGSQGLIIKMRADGVPESELQASTDDPDPTINNKPNQQTK